MKHVPTILCFLVSAAFCVQPTVDTCFFRSGQTFMTWQEDNTQTGEKYRIYRSTQPITTGNIGGARLVAEIAENSSYFTEMHVADGSLANTIPSCIDRVVIFPLSHADSATNGSMAQQVSAGTGVFVWTVKEESSADFYYAIRTVAAGGGEEQTVSAGNTAGPITELRQPINAILYNTGTESRGGKLCNWYLIWMDYELFKENYMGYVFAFGVWREMIQTGDEIPYIMLHGYGNPFPGNEWSCIPVGDFLGGEYLSPSGFGSLPTWFFGFHKSAAYRGSEATGSDRSDSVANYVQYRIIQSFLWTRRHYGISEPKMHISGGSMGGSGAFGFAIHFPRFVTSVWAQQGMTNYANTWREDNQTMMYSRSIYGNYGRPGLHNPVSFLPINDPRYPGIDWVTGCSGMDVYEARRVPEFMRSHANISFPYIGATHQYDDGSIPWPNQGAPLEEYLKNSRQSFGYGVSPGGHGWDNAFCPIMITWDHSDFRWDESRPGFSNVPARKGCRYGSDITDARTYMSYVKWGMRDAPLSGNRAIVETETSWSVPIISQSECSDRDEAYYVDITPRNLQYLDICEGDTFIYEIADITGSTVEAQGEIVADSIQLLLIPQVPIRLSGAAARVTLKARGVSYPCEDMDPTTSVNRSRLVSARSADASELKVHVQPNPFNSTTVFTITVPAVTGHVRAGHMRIFNIQGGLIRDFILPCGNAGTLHLTWNSMDSNGRGIASGIYICSVSLGGKSVSKRIILTK
ncbi:MAG: hypothetical protein A2350_08145 [Candidatus Raymondbacteria bacterium RifOxyB12_full_50_8]|nr:MAG: hypothetical protein A2248_09280 [Candidatus Raymondbacteria bacterium RIFOXYA2_FULL_49_16]OGJ93440.1 MAG: hypothetical protein A2350_08145 [Candidatus Raymondbacteria bacterium RifOxyB12_full_50_8]OGP41231.1 MAG: hypothetical protein A2324_13850 [Candidatus Raymondbacteria bacterium RIFOXYB2_FULL_49_35]